MLLKISKKRQACNNIKSDVLFRISHAVNVPFIPFLPFEYTYSHPCFPRAGLGAFSALVFRFGNPTWKLDADRTHVVSFFWFPRPCKDYPTASSRSTLTPVWGAIFGLDRFRPPTRGVLLDTVHPFNLVHCGYPFFTKRGRC